MGSSAQFRLTREQRAAFERSGLVWLRGAVDPNAVRAMRDRVWAFLLEQHGASPDQPDSWVSVTSSKFRPLERDGTFDPVWSEVVRGAIDELLEPANWTAGKPASSLLMNFPSTQDWDVPHKVWHLDYRAPGWLRSLPGMQMFVFVDRVEPGGGGTLTVAGSHTLVDAVRKRRGHEFDGASAKVRRELRRSVPWLHELWTLRDGEDRVERFMKTCTEFEGAPLQVLEMTGEPGDAVLMHPWTLHAPAQNTSNQARMMLVGRVHATR